MFLYYIYLGCDDRKNLRTKSREKVFMGNDRMENRSSSIGKRINLIHYGADKFIKEAVRPVKNDWVKPYGGFWASPVNAERGWKEWCIAEDFELQRLKRYFTVTFIGRVIVIDCVKDLDNLIWLSDAMIDFKTLSERIDAIYLTWNGQCETRFSCPRSLYGWDCESVLVMNPDCLYENHTNRYGMAAIA